MDKETFDALPEEEREAIIKKRSQHRLLMAFIIIDVALICYIVYALIMLFTHL